MQDHTDDTVSKTGGLFAEHKEDLPEEWHETFDELTAQGKSPSGIKATIEYVTSQKSQEEVSSETNVSEVTIRNLQAAVIALGPIEAKEDAHWNTGRQSSMDFCNHIADRLGWEEGVEYSVSEGGYRQTKQPTLLKEGWRALFEEITDPNGHIDYGVGRGGNDD